MPTPVRLLLTPAGAGLALLCFFLPWGRFSCMGMHRVASGAGLHFWGVFWAAFLILAAGGALVFLGRIRHAQIAVVGAALYALGFLVVQAVRFSRGIHTPIGSIDPGTVGISPRFGGVGTVIGFVVAAAGAFLLVPPPRGLFGLLRGGKPGGERDGRRSPGR